MQVISNKSRWAYASFRNEHLARRVGELERENEAARSKLRGAYDALERGMEGPDGQGPEELLAFVRALKREAEEGSTVRAGPAPQMEEHAEELRRQEKEAEVLRKQVQEARTALEGREQELRGVREGAMGELFGRRGFMLWQIASTCSQIRPQT